MNKAMNYLGLARRGGLAELGEEPVGAVARTGKAYVILRRRYGAAVHPPELHQG